MGRGLLLREELNRAERYVQQPALQLLTARRLHDYTLPDAWSVVAAINPEDGDYQVAPLDPALRGRFLQLRVRADRAAWLTWARHQGIHPAVLQVARTHDRLFDEVPPRTWKHVSDLLALRAPKMQERLLRDALGGYLPPAWMESLLKAAATGGKVEGHEVSKLLAAYARDDRAQRMLVAYRDGGRTDVLEMLTYQIESQLQDHAESADLIGRRGIDLACFERLLQDLPGDYAERLQAALGANPWAVALLGVKPGEVLKSYRGSSIALAVAQWLAGRRLRHRAWALGTAVTRYPVQHPDQESLRANGAVRDSIAHLLDQLGPEAGRPLGAVVEQLGLANDTGSAGRLAA